MPQSVSILITVVIAALTITANAVISTRIKFAPDAASATRELKQFGSGVLRWVATLAVVGMLVYLVAKPEPLTRPDAFLIAVNVAVLLFAMIMGLMLRVVDRVFGYLMRAMDALQAQATITTRAIEQQAETEARHIAITERVVDGRTGAASTGKQQVGD